MTRFRIVNVVMAALFALAVAVQYNDPDPLRWMAIYGVACAVSIAAAVHGQAPLGLTAAAALVALTWSVYWAATSTAGVAMYEHMFDSWEMKNLPVEEAREASGLLIVTVWMVVLSVHAWKRRSS